MMHNLDRHQLEAIMRLINRKVRERERALARFHPFPGQAPEDADAARQKIENGLAYFVELRADYRRFVRGMDLIKRLIDDLEEPSLHDLEEAERADYEEHLWEKRRDR